MRCASIILLILSLAAVAQAADPAFRVPAGFEVARVAGDDLAHDIWCLTLDAKGRIVVGGAGYIKRLDDADGDGRCDAVTTLATFAGGGPQGLCYVGEDLYHVGPGKLGVIRGDANAAALPDDFLTFASSGEHGPHGIVQGPDGNLYVVCGNDAHPNGAIDADSFDPCEPVAGQVLRVDLAHKKVDVVAWGFRNPYDLAFTPQGRLLTVDSDNERAYHLPWYAPMRLYDVAPGRGHGWLLTGHQSSWNRPASYFDSAPRVVELGRGSPTGLETYRHSQFPEHYRGGVFSACWTFGRVHFIELKTDASGLTLVGRAEEFLAPASDDGFAPVDLAVTPAGDLLVAIGGRHTQGGVFRIRYVGPDAGAEPPPGNQLAQVLDAPQPLSAWSRQRWLPMARMVGRTEFVRAALDENITLDQRIRAIEVITEVWGPLVAQEASFFSPAPQQVKARAAWSLGRNRVTDNKTLSALASSSLTTWIDKDDQPVAQRATWDAMAELAPLETKRLLHNETLLPRSVRQAQVFFGWRGKMPRRLKALPTDWLVDFWLGQTPEDMDAATREKTWVQTADLFAQLEVDSLRGELVRIFGLLLGDIVPMASGADALPGYVAAHPDWISVDARRAVGVQLVAALPAADAELQRELARLLAMFEVPAPGARAAIAALVTDESAQVDDVHYLTALSRIDGDGDPQSTERIAAGLVSLHRKLAAAQGTPSREWPEWISRVEAGLLQRDPSLAEAIIAHPAFGEPEHELLARSLPDEPKSLAATRILERLTESPDLGDRMTSELVQLLDDLPAGEVLPVLRECFDEYSCRDAIAIVLARQGHADDRARLVEALATSDTGVVRRVAEALANTPAADSESEAAALVVALRRLCRVPAGKDARIADGDRQARAAIVAALEKLAGRSLPIDASQREFTIAYAACFDWFTEAYPDKAALLGGTAIDWKARFAQVEWDAGDIARGQTFFRRKACAACHEGNDRLGPDLAGIGGRLARDDLFTAITAPSRDFTPQYEVRAVVTRSGAVHQGMIVYESPEGLLLRTGADTTVRVEGPDLDRMEPGNRSFMPDGLLDDASDADLADLYAYLRSLKK